MITIEENAAVSLCPKAQERMAKRLKLRKTGVITIIVIAILIVYATITLTDLRGRIDDAEINRQQLQQQVSAETAENDELRHAVENSEDDEVIEGIARDKLGMVMPGEKVFIKE